MSFLVFILWFLTATNVLDFLGDQSWLRIPYGVLLTLLILIL